MARKLRIEYEGAIYHLMNRGDRREPIFLDDRDRELFTSTLGETCLKTCWKVHAYCWMSNHFPLLGAEEKLQVYAWSSFPAYLLPPGKRPPWLRVDRVFGEMGIPKDTTAGREQFRQGMEQRRRSEDSDSYGKIRRGWCLGEESFRKELLEGMGERMGAEHYGEERHESATQKAELVVEEELRKRRLSRAGLAALPKGHRAKVELARRLQAETTVPVGWIAEHLGMGTRSYAYRLLYLDRKRRSRRQ